jgi:transcriptional regulator with XRE-family HTH domain
MNLIERDIDKVLMHLRHLIRRQGFTQLNVQKRLNWGTSYVSQLVTKQKLLRVDQLLRILEVINVPPGEFFAEVFPAPQRPVNPWERLQSGWMMGPPVWSWMPTPTEEEQVTRLQALGELLVAKGLLKPQEVTAVLKSAAPAPPDLLLKEPES